VVHMRLVRHVPSRYKVSIESRTFLHFCLAGKQAGMAMCMVHHLICREVFSLHGVHEVVFHCFDRMGIENGQSIHLQCIPTLMLNLSNCRCELMMGKLTPLFHDTYKGTQQFLQKD